MILGQTIKKASQILKNHNIHTYELDAQIILSDIMGVTKEFLITKESILFYYKLLRLLEAQKILTKQ